MKGVIGVRTSYSTGQGTVAEYAAVAKQAGLQFVIFLDEYWLDGTGDKLMTPAILAKLEADCVAHSTPDLYLYPGFSMKNNIGAPRPLVWPRSPLLILLTCPLPAS